MKIKTSEATDRQLNWMIATKIEGLSYSSWRTDGPATDWSEGGPIIERECIQIGCIHTTGWTPNSWDARHPQRVFAKGSTPLIAAMRCYVTYKLGEEVDVPDEFK